MRSSNKSQIISSLNLYLTETESQYDDCYGEASKQEALLEIQRDAISSLKKKIYFLECDEFLNVFMLHCIYYVILFKYQEELKSQTEEIVCMKSTVNELLRQKSSCEKENETLKDKCQCANDELSRLRCDFQNSLKQFTCEARLEMDKLKTENSDLKKQVQIYKLDLDFIEEEIKKMKPVDSSVENFKIELNNMRSKFKCYMDYYQKVIKELKHQNECLTKKLQDLQACKTANIEKSKEKQHSLQHEINLKNEEIKNLTFQVTNKARVVEDQLKIIVDLTNKLSCQEHRVCYMRIQLKKLEKDVEYLTRVNESLKVELEIVKVESKNELRSLTIELKQTKCDLREVEEKYKKTSQKLKSCLRPHEFKGFNGNEGQTTRNSNCNCKNSQEGAKKIQELQKCLVETREELASARSELKALLCKYEHSEQSCRHQKDEIMALEKRLGCLNQRFESCKSKNEEFVRQNMILEDNNNKCMAELEDIVLQLEDMQSSLVDLRSECDVKAQSLENVSVELAKMKVSRLETFEESKHVLEWVRVWMREQKNTTSKLQEMLREKQESLNRISTNKKNFMLAIKRLRRVNKILGKRLKLIRKPVTKQIAVVPNPNCSLQRVKKLPIKQKPQLSRSSHSPHSLYLHKSSAVYSYFKKESRQGVSCIEKLKGDSRYFNSLKYLSKKLPNSQIHKNIRTEDMADCGYQTSSSK